MSATETDRKKAAENPDVDLTEAKETPFLFLKGFCMGSADVVPGVSGGTMALILGIYTRLINTIRSVNLQVIWDVLRFRFNDVFRQVHWKFAVSVLAGMIAAIVFFTRVVPLPVLMHTHPELIYGLFFGLILGSIFLLFKELRALSWKVVLWTLAGTFVGYQVVTLVPADTPDHPLFIFFSGALAISAMVLPGISGSFILLILRKYDTVLGAIGNLGGSQSMEALIILIPFGLGLVFGIALFARLLSWLLRVAHLPTICVLIGFMAGSLYIIWPFQEREYVESVTVEVVPLESEKAQQVLASDPDERLLEYKRPGSIVNPEAPAAEQKIEIETVKRRLIGSRPFIPDREGTHPALSRGTDALYHGYMMILAGLALVAALGFVSMKKQKPD